jgi:hypothetical protein
MNRTIVPGANAARLRLILVLVSVALAFDSCLSVTAALNKSVTTRDLGGGFFLVEDIEEGTCYAVKAVITPEQWNRLTDPKWIPQGLFYTHEYQEELDNIAGRIYTLFEDRFDFLLFVFNTNDRSVGKGIGKDGMSSPVNNDVDGIGLPKTRFAHSFSKVDSVKTLKSWIYLPRYNNIPGNALHEIAHTWAAHIKPAGEKPGELRHLVDATSGHWFYSNAGGQLGGFKYVRKVETKGGRTVYQGSMSPDTWWDDSFDAGGFDPARAYRPYTPYSDIELYLMGMKSAQELRDAGFTLDLYTGIGIDSDGDYPSDEGYFSATGVTSYTIDDIIALHGPRVPDAGAAQKRFKVLTVILTPQGTEEDFSGAIVDDLKWLAGGQDTPPRRGKDGDYINFAQATLGRGSLEVGGIEKSLKGAGNSLQAEEKSTVVAVPTEYVEDKPKQQPQVPEIKPCPNAPAAIPAVTETSNVPRFSVPVIDRFEKGKYYLQLASYRYPQSAQAEVDKLSLPYPVVIMRARVIIGNEEVLVNRVLIGPVNRDESRALLKRFKSDYTDAFVWLGK